MDPEVFSLDPPALRARGSAKWSKYPEDILPAWIADMDTGIAPAVREALETLTVTEAYTYPARGTHLVESFARRMSKRFSWSISSSEIVAVVDLVQATFASVLAFSERGDGVIVQLPSYPAFPDAVYQTGRRLIQNPMVNDRGTWTLDLEALDHACDKRTRVLIFCHPHNPTGRVYDASELGAVAEFVLAHDLVVVSDEIFGDMVYPPATHIPLASLGADIASRTVTITSASKSFNIAALRCGVMHFGSPALKSCFEARIPARLLGVPSVTGVDATISAWDHSQPWLEEIQSYLHSTRDWLVTELKENLPGIQISPPGAGFLAWLDCRAMKIPSPVGQFFLERAKVALNPGEEFGAAYSDFARLNFATSRSILRDVVDRMSQAVASARLAS